MQIIVNKNTKPIAEIEWQILSNCLIECCEAFYRKKESVAAFEAWKERRSYEAKNNH